LESSEPSVEPMNPEEVDKKQTLWTDGPYPKDSDYNRSQAKYSYRPAVSPEDTSIVLFPGQGTQYVGMAQDLLDYPMVQEMFSHASQVLGTNLLQLCMEGPANTLAKTAVQQMAIYVTSLAAVEKLRHESPGALQNCVGTAGFSVGEYAALTFAGAITFEEGLELVKVRSEAMQSASELLPGGMATIMYGANSRVALCCDTAREYCKQRGVVGAECRVAAFLGPNTKVVAGSEEALQFLAEHKQDFNIRRLKRLNVSGAFHSSHMEPAAEELKEALKNVTISPSKFPVHCNVDGRPYRKPFEIKKNLVKQLTRAVRWEQSMHTIYERGQGVAFPNTYALGPGNSCKTMLAMVNEKAAHKTHCIST